MKTIKISMLLLVLVFLNSCGSSTKLRNTYKYANTSLGNLKTYTAKPIYNGTKETGTYLSVGLNTGENNQNRGISLDKKTILNAEIYRSHTAKHYNFHYGIGGSSGTYTFGNSLTNHIEVGEKKSFYNISAKTGMNYNISKKNVDLRLFGVELTYNREFGDYHDKITSLPLGEYSPDYAYIRVTNPKSLFSFNVSTEAVFKLKNNNNLAVGIFSGRTIYIQDTSGQYGRTDDNNPIYGGVYTAFTLNRVTLSLLYQTTHYKTSGNFIFKHFSYGLTYKILGTKKKSISIKNIKN